VCCLARVVYGCIIVYMEDVAGVGAVPVHDMSETERRLCSAFGRGVLVDLRSGHPHDDDPENSDQWSQARVVRAEVIKALLLGAVEPVAGFVAGMRIAGARVAGVIDVRRGTVSCAVEMTDCHLAGELLLAEATTRTVDLSGSVLQSLDAQSALVDGDRLLDRCRTDQVHLLGARISGLLSLNGAHLTNPSGYALAADRLAVGHDIYCQGFEAEGEIRLPGAHIAGQLILNGAHLTNPGGRALNANHLTVEGDLVCENGFEAEGEIRLLYAHIAGELVLNGAHLTNPGAIALTER